MRRHLIELLHHRGNVIRETEVDKTVFIDSKGREYITTGPKDSDRAFIYDGRYYRPYDEPYALNGDMPKPGTRLFSSADYARIKDWATRRSLLERISKRQALDELARYYRYKDWESFFGSQRIWQK
jgi:hypothetical protein